MSGELSPSRRRFALGAAAGATAAWVAPAVLTVDAAAAATKVMPAFVSSATAYSQGGVLAYSRSITLTTPNVQAGDLWLAVVAYDVRGSVSMPGSPAQVSGPVNANSGSLSVYSVRAYLVARTLLASDISGGSHSATFFTATDPIDYGGLRGAAAVYRSIFPIPLPAVQSQAGYGPVNLSSIVTSTFPAAGATPATPNRVVRVGAARGFGGLLAVGASIDWQSGPGTMRVDYNADNFGDRALWVSDQPDNGATSATGTWFRQVALATQNWVTFTVSVVP